MLVDRYPRESYQIADKLVGYLVKIPEGFESQFHIQLGHCGVDYFDVYMLHWLSPENYRIAERFDEFGFLQRLKSQGSASLLDEILRKHPEDDCKIQPVYEKLALSHGTCSDCVGCRQCEAYFPQNISISQWITKVAPVMETWKRHLESVPFT